MEIRCVVGAVDGWEIVSEAGCCVFAWERLGGVGVVYVEAHHCSECVAAVKVYAASRGYSVRERYRDIVCQR